MQREKNAFWNEHLFGTEEGIHLAVPPDLMHVMLEGLAKHIIGCCITEFTTGGALCFFIQKYYHLLLFIVHYNLFPHKKGY